MGSRRMHPRSVLSRFMSSAPQISTWSNVLAFPLHPRSYLRTKWNKSFWSKTNESLFHLRDHHLSFQTMKISASSLHAISALSRGKPSPSRIRNLLLLAKDAIFDSLVTRKRGGPCLEKSPSFASLLETLGYDVYMVLGRVWLDNTHSCPPPTHVVFIVTLDGVEYLVDVGLPHAGLTAPLPIFNGNIIETPMNGVLPGQSGVQMTEIFGFLGGEITKSGQCNIVHPRTQPGRGSIHSRRMRKFFNSDMEL